MGGNDPKTVSEILPEVTPDHRHQLVAGGIAIAVNIALIAALLRLPGTGRTAKAADDSAIAIHWITRAPISAAISPLAPIKPILASKHIEQKASSPAIKREEATPAQPADVMVVASDEWGLSSSSDTSPHTSPNDVTPWQKPRTNAAFSAPQSDLFAMQDSSIGGRLDRMGRNMLCRDLRLLARGSDLQLQRRGVSREVVIRTVQSENCRL